MYWYAFLLLSAIGIIFFAIQLHTVSGSQTTIALYWVGLGLCILLLGTSIYSLLRVRSLSPKTFSRQDDDFGIISEPSNRVLPLSQIDQDIDTIRQETRYKLSTITNPYRRRLIQDLANRDIQRLLLQRTEMLSNI